MTAWEIAELSRRQLADYDAHRPGRVFEDASLRLTIAEAYQVQKQVAQLRAVRGEAVVGYKIGCLSETVQAQLGIDRPVFGHIFATELHTSGATLDPASFDHLAIEGELAVRIAEDISQTNSLVECPGRAIASVFVVIELHNHVLRGARRRPEELIANNALHAGVVLPALETSLGDADELMGKTISVLRNGELLGMAMASAIPGGPFASVLRVVDHLASMGGMVRQGDIVLTGSPLPLYPVQAGDRIEVRGEALTPVELFISSAKEH